MHVVLKSFNSDKCRTNTRKNSLCILIKLQQSSKFISFANAALNVKQRKIYGQKFMQSAKTSLIHSKNRN